MKANVTITLLLRRVATSNTSARNELWRGEEGTLSETVISILAGQRRRIRKRRRQRKRERARVGISNLRRQCLASPTAQVLVAQTTRPVQKNWLRDELYSYVRIDTVDWELGGGKRRGKKHAEEQQGQTGAGQRREWQLNGEREEIKKDVEEGEENINVEEREKGREWGSNPRQQRLASRLPRCSSLRPLGWFKIIGFVTSFIIRATFGLPRSIGGWEEGGRWERNKRKRQPRQTSGGQRREWQLNEQREEIKREDKGKI